ncbi:phage tail protein [Pectobacterium peruviense]|uniref:phage tail protein n=1 Tax=Pectobacterium peruviense TaxID=2066479 RepID=UPI000DE3EE59|nr:phage tail protein [Pectobacterium peruviense]
MANLSENPQWVDGIYQIETSDPVVGGPDGVSNRQAKELASRTRYLKKEQEKTGSDLATHAAAADPHTQYAPKADPTFTGTPKAPTPTIDSNSQQVATTAFVKSVGATKLAKDQNGADIPDRELFNRNLGSSRAYSSSIPIGGSAGLWTTAEFIGWLESQGAFVHAYWVCRGSWSYAHNKIISDTECGQIPLAGSVVEVVGQHDATTIRVTTPSTAPSGLSDSANAQFTYVYNGGDYSPGWRRDYNTKNKPTAADVGALPEKATALEAAKLATPRTINGVPFDGTTNIALTPANLGLTETVDLAAGALAKAKNGADISDKTAFYNNVTLRGTLGDGMTFANCDKAGDYVVAINDPNTVSDMPVYKGQKLYGYGVLHVFQHGNFVGQEYINHSGDCAWRQKWDDGINAPWVIALSSSRVPTAADVGAITKTDADNYYVRQGSSGVIYQDSDLAWDSPTGAYLKDNGTHSSLIWHMGLNTGSASAAQFYFDFANSGLKYRSSRDNSGFEKQWARIYSDQDKPTAAEIGALSLNEIVGMPMPWPQTTAPSGWLKCNGQTFDKNIYPKLAQIYSAGVLPDLRGEFIRGWDDNRGVDTGRTLLSIQGDAIRNIVGEIWTTAVNYQFLGENLLSNGAFELSKEFTVGAIPDAAGSSCPSRMKFDASRIVPTASENRPRNIAFNYIVRAA